MFAELEIDKFCCETLRAIVEREHSGTITPKPNMELLGFGECVWII
jgi:hypothetical protein